MSKPSTVTVPPSPVTQEHAARRFLQIAEIEREILEGEIAIGRAKDSLRAARAVLKELQEHQAMRIVDLRGAARDEGPLPLPFEEFADGQVPS